MRDSYIVCVCVCVCDHKRKSIVVNVQIHNGTAGRLFPRIFCDNRGRIEMWQELPDPAPGKGMHMFRKNGL